MSMFVDGSLFVRGWRCAVVLFVLGLEPGEIEVCCRRVVMPFDVCVLLFVRFPF